MYREAIYHPDLSIFKMYHISLPSTPAHILFECSPATRVPQSSEDFFISTRLDEQSEIKTGDKGTSERENKGRDQTGKWYNDREKSENFSLRKDREPGKRVVAVL